jgi:hypothetical protein
MPENYVKVYIANGATDAVMIKMFLESLEIPAVFYEEAAGVVYGLTVGPLADTEIWVPAEKADEAIELLRKMEDGELSLQSSEPMEIPPELEELAEENRQIQPEEEPDQPQIEPENPQDD